VRGAGRIQVRRPGRRRCPSRRTHTRRASTPTGGEATNDDWVVKIASTPTGGEATNDDWVVKIASTPTGGEATNDD